MLKNNLCTNTSVDREYQKVKQKINCIMFTNEYPLALGNYLEF
jgi:hypothetical protein